ncbi:CD59 glycoprotein [Amia ocellicauda]|uniref:CD59B glycoprotein n=1 Tax=Amia ocellicauda TaxID=2972642 RepID=UPI00346485CB
MKSSLIVAAVLLLALSCGDALRCYKCLAGGSGQRCTRTVETCLGSNDACVSAIFLPPTSGFFQRCGKSSECALYSTTNLIQARCCNRDLCN